jgi:hypothetical protein
MQDMIDLNSDTRPHPTLMWPVVLLIIIGVLYAGWLWFPYYQWATTLPPKQYALQYSQYSMYGQYSVYRVDGMYVFYDGPRSIYYPEVGCYDTYPHDP